MHIIYVYYLDVLVYGLAKQLNMTVTKQQQQYIYPLFLDYFPIEAITKSWVELPLLDINMSIWMSITY